MYYYILDPAKVSPERFEKLQVELQGLLSEFNISGEMARVTSIRTIGDLVDTASSRGVKTLVACGDDDTFNIMLAALQGRDFTLAFVPFVQDSYLARIFGIDSLSLAAKTIAARRVEKIDMARVANQYFISYLEFGVLAQKLKSANWWNNLKILSSPASQLTLRIDGSYTMNLECLGGLIINSRSTSSKTERLANPTDTYLDLIMLERLNKASALKHRKAIAEGILEAVPNHTLIKCRRVEFLDPPGYPISLAGRVITKSPIIVEMVDLKLRIIVGKNRTF